MENGKQSAKAQAKAARIDVARHTSLGRRASVDRNAYFKLTVGRSSSPVDLAIDQYIVSKAPLVMPATAASANAAPAGKHVPGSRVAWSDECVLRMHLRGFKQLDIAQALNISVKTVGRKLKRISSAQRTITKEESREIVGRAMAVTNEVIAMLFRLSDKRSTPDAAKIRALSAIALANAEQFRALIAIGVIRREDFSRTPDDEQIEEIINALFDGQEPEPPDLGDLDEEALVFASGCKASQ